MDICSLLGNARSMVRRGPDWPWCLRHSMVPPFPVASSHLRRPCDRRCTTLGIGFDIVPSSQLETVYTLICSGMGIFMFSFIVGAASEALSELDSLGQEQRQKMKSFQHYMHTRGVSHSLARRVLAYQRYAIESNSGDDVHDTLQRLPTTLHRQLNISINRKLFINVRPLPGCRLRSPPQACTHLKLAPLPTPLAPCRCASSTRAVPA